MYCLSFIMSVIRGRQGFVRTISLLHISFFFLFLTVFSSYLFRNLHTHVLPQAETGTAPSAYRRPAFPSRPTVDIYSVVRDSTRMLKHTNWTFFLINSIRADSVLIFHSFSCSLHHRWDWINYLFIHSHTLICGIMFFLLINSSADLSSIKLCCSHVSWALRSWLLPWFSISLSPSALLTLFFSKMYDYGRGGVGVIKKQHSKLVHRKMEVIQDTLAVTLTTITYYLFLLPTLQSVITNRGKFACLSCLY